ncbi:putative E3 ubiquitin-protein ligase HIP1 [Sesamum alatum]|uniref:RING-type E3 ubiquitin transferase n=1 Tax=Sesamum alatum TaxID=300844 RepID=A0AAE2CHL4_9LAMI|nr:putative E3 ubiquitin-protein ligase HIP1 [Sesamum alatum]
MDRYSGKRTAAGIMAPRKGYNVTFKDTTTEQDQNEFCNRIGCSGRMKYSSQNVKIGSPDKGKCSRHPFCSSNGNEMIGNSSRSRSVRTRAKSSYLDPNRKLSSQLEFDQSESQSGDSEAPELVSSPSRSPTRHHSGSMNNPREVNMAEIGSSSLPSNTRSREKLQHKSGPNSQPASSVPSVSQISGLGTLNSSNRSRYGLRNMKCNSISDVVSASCSSSESKSAGKNVMKKRSPEGESSSSRRRQTNSAASVDGVAFASTSGISISDSRRSSFIPGEDSTPATSVRTRRSTNINNNRMRLSYRPNGRNSSSIREPAFGVSQVPDSDRPINIGGPRLSQQFSANGSSSGSSSYSLSSRNDDDNQSTMMPFTPAELGSSRLMNRESLPRYNMDGIAEVLLALERIEQYDELTHEQVLALEMSLFLGGLSLYDQHRDMRLDIDNMSYEELLALEERMGTVSTALSEEALPKCVRRSTYQTTPSEVRVAGLGDDGDDIKCSICQEEYELGDEIGKLVGCQHGYHLTCINQWLRLKNWCPICKSAASSSSS